MPTSPQRRRWPSRRFFAFTLALCAALPLLAQLRPAPPPVVAKPYHFPSRELEELDRALQARLAVVPDSDFGLSRVGQRHGYFYPTIPSEKAAVQSLKKAKQEVVFYVVGRNAILKQWNAYGHAPVQGPVYITPTTPFKVEAQVVQWTQARFLSEGGVAKDAPSDGELISLARRVFAAGELRNGTNAAIGTWNVVARPIAASSQECVDCHNTRPPWKPVNQRLSITWHYSQSMDMISLGDTVGVALYCYRPARKIAIKKLTDEELLSKRDQ